MLGIRNRELVAVGLGLGAEIEVINDKWLLTEKWLVAWESGLGN